MARWRSPGTHQINRTDAGSSETEDLGTEKNGLLASFRKGSKKKPFFELIGISLPCHFYLTISKSIRFALTKL